MTAPVLSVVIPTRNRREILMATLRALAKERGIDGGLEVIVADDGSTDGSAELVRGSVFESFTLRVLTLDAGGPARARNRAIAEASNHRSSTAIRRTLLMPTPAPSRVNPTGPE